MPAKPKTHSAYKIATDMLIAFGQPTKVGEVVEAAIKDRRSINMKGATPGATLSAQLYVAAKSGRKVASLDGSKEGVILKVDRGVLAFKAARRRA